MTQTRGQKGSKLRVADLDLESARERDVDQGYAEQYAEFLRQAPRLEFDAVDVFHVAGHERPVVTHGQHRCAAYRLAGRERIPLRHHRGTIRDAILFAAPANHRNGRQTTPEERERLTIRFLTDPQFEDLSQRQIAKLVGFASDAGVRAIWKKLEERRDEPPAQGRVNGPHGQEESEAGRQRRPDGP